MQVYEGEYVRSRFHGLGRVVIGGRMPTLLFLDGRRCRVSGDTLVVVPEEFYVAEVMNRRALERYLNQRVHGIAEANTPLPPSRKFDLATAMNVELTNSNGREEEPIEEQVSCFILDDLKSAGRGAPAEDVQSRPLCER